MSRTSTISLVGVLSLATICGACRSKRLGQRADQFERSDQAGLHLISEAQRRAVRDYTTALMKVSSSPTSAEVDRMQRLVDQMRKELGNTIQEIDDLNRDDPGYLRAMDFLGHQFGIGIDDEIERARMLTSGMNYNADHPLSVLVNANGPQFNAESLIAIRDQHANQVHRNFKVFYDTMSGKELSDKLKTRFPPEAIDALKKGLKDYYQSFFHEEHSRRAYVQDYFDNLEPQERRQLFARSLADSEDFYDILVKNLEHAEAPTLQKFWQNLATVVVQAMGKKKDAESVRILKARFDRLTSDMPDDGIDHLNARVQAQKGQGFVITNRSQILGSGTLATTVRPYNNQTGKLADRVVKVFKKNAGRNLDREARHIDRFEGLTGNEKLQLLGQVGAGKQEMVPKEEADNMKIGRRWASLYPDAGLYVPKSYPVNPNCPDCLEQEFVEGRDISKPSIEPGPNATPQERIDYIKKERARSKAQIALTTSWSLELLFGSGNVHADPHGGNIMWQYLPGKNPPWRTGVIDWGRMLKVGPEMRAAILELIPAVMLGKSADAVKAVSKLTNVRQLNPTQKQQLDARMRDLKVRLEFAFIDARITALYDSISRIKNDIGRDRKVDKILSHHFGSTALDVVEAEFTALDKISSPLSSQAEEFENILALDRPLADDEIRRIEAFFPKMNEVVTAMEASHKKLITEPNAAYKKSFPNARGFDLIKTAKAPFVHNFAAASEVLFETNRPVPFDVAGGDAVKSLVQMSLSSLTSEAQFANAAEVQMKAMGLEGRRAFMKEVVDMVSHSAMVQLVTWHKGSSGKDRLIELDRKALLAEVRATIDGMDADTLVRALDRLNGGGEFLKSLSLSEVLPKAIKRGVYSGIPTGYGVARAMFKGRFGVGLPPGKVVGAGAVAAAAGVVGGAGYILYRAIQERIERQQEGEDVEPDSDSDSEPVADEIE